MLRHYLFPPKINFAELFEQAEKRRAVLVAGGCSTYTLGTKGDAPAIVCLCCGLGSSNPNDIEQKYCGFCHAWHSEWRIER